MKRALRILIRIITAPVVISAQILIITFIITFIIPVGMGFVFSEWLFENADLHYSNLDAFKSTIKDFKNYWKGFLK